MTVNTRVASPVAAPQPFGASCTARLEDMGVRETRMTTSSLRSESWQENVSAMAWLSTSIVHDLRNPLGSIYATAEMLMDLDPMPIEVKRLATNMYRAVGRMRELLADLNSVALGNTLTPEMCDIGEVIATASDTALTPWKTIAFRSCWK